MIIEKMIQETKQFHESLLLDPTHKKYIFRNQQNARDSSFLMYKPISALQLNRGYEVVLHLDITHLENPEEKKISIEKAFKAFVEKSPEIFGTWDEKKMHLRFIERVANEKVITTNLIEHILSKNQLPKLLEVYDNFLVEAITKVEASSENFKNMVATIFKDLTREAGFFPIEEMKRIGIFDYSETTEYLNNPYNALPSETFSDQTNESTYSSADKNKFFKPYNQGELNLNSKILRILEMPHTSYNFIEQPKPIIQAIILPYETLPKRKSRGYSTHKPEQTTDIGKR